MVLVFVGSATSFEPWRATAEVHVRALECAPLSEQHALLDGSILGVVAAAPPAGKKTLVDRSGDIIHASLSPYEQRSRLSGNAISELWRDPREALATNDVKILASLSSSEIRFIVPPATPDHLHFVRNGSDYAFSNDPRLLGRRNGFELDAHVAVALLQHGAIPAPFSVVRGGRRVPGGHVAVVARDRDPDIQPFFYFSERQEAPPRRDVERMVETHLDESVATIPPDSALLFSGGVDSTLLATRLAELGRRDVHLVNFSFGRDDEEAALAQHIARLLDLPFEQIAFRPSEIQAVLERIGRDYSAPFADTSVVPTNMLVHEVLRHVRPRSVVDGTGADGLFGMWQKARAWRQVYSLPRPLRLAVAAAYARAGIWRGSARHEYVGRIIRRSTQLPLLCAGVTAQNALAGIAYEVPPEANRDIARALVSHATVLGEHLSAEKRYSLLDLLHVCADEFAAKTFDPFRARAIPVLYPFLEPKLLRAMFAFAWGSSFKEGGAKAPLKSIVARTLPDEIVYRPKSGFIAPLHELFASRPVQQLFHEVVLDPSNPLASFFREPAVRTLLHRATRVGCTGTGGHYFLWSLAFASAWHDQVVGSSET